MEQEQKSEQKKNQRKKTKGWNCKDTNANRHAKTATQKKQCREQMREPNEQDSDSGREFVPESSGSAQHWAVSRVFIRSVSRSISALIFLIKIFPQKSFRGGSLGLKAVISN